MIACRMMCNASMEHAQSLKILIRNNKFTSAIAILRMQYEAFVRGIWLLYAANDTALSKITNELNIESERIANKLPMLSEMIKQLDGKAPEEAVLMINDFKEATWKSLGSYVHSGIHVIHGQNTGYPLDYIVQIIESSNGLSTMNAMLLAILTADPDITDLASDIQFKFQDCLPKLAGSKS